MKIPIFKTLWKTDFEQTYQNLVEKLGYSINPQMQSIQSAVNGALTLQDNIQCTVKSFTIKVDSTGTPMTTTQFSLTSSGKLTGITVLSAINQTTSTVYPTSAPFISSSNNGTVITINNITGLPANNSFLITIVAYTS